MNLNVLSISNWFNYWTSQINVPEIIPITVSLEVTGRGKWTSSVKTIKSLLK